MFGQRLMCRHLAGRINAVVRTNFENGDPGGIAEHAPVLFRNLYQLIAYLLVQGRCVEMTSSKKRKVENRSKQEFGGGVVTVSGLGSR